MTQGAFRGIVGRLHVGVFGEGPEVVVAVENVLAHAAEFAVQREGSLFEGFVDRPPERPKSTLHRAAGDGAVALAVPMMKQRAGQAQQFVADGFRLPAGVGQRLEVAPASAPNKVDAAGSSRSRRSGPR